MVHITPVISPPLFLQVNTVKVSEFLQQPSMNDFHRWVSYVIRFASSIDLVHLFNHCEGGENLMAQLFSATRAIVTTSLYDWRGVFRREQHKHIPSPDVDDPDYARLVPWLEHTPLLPSLSFIQRNEPIQDYIDSIHHRSHPQHLPILFVLEHPTQQPSSLVRVSQSRPTNGALHSSWSASAGGESGW